MKANVSYNDLIGSVAVDISDSLRSLAGDDIKSIGKYYNLDEDKFEIIGLLIDGPSKLRISFICIDKNLSQENNKHIVRMNYDIDNNGQLLTTLFKRLNLVLYNKFDKMTSELDYVEEVNFSDFH